MTGRQVFKSLASTAVNRK